jgi:hypothetical protein
MYYRVILGTQGLAFGEPLPSTNISKPLTRRAAIVAARIYRLDPSYDSLQVQIVNEDTGRIENITQNPENPNVIVVSVDATNPCGGPHPPF